MTGCRHCGQSIGCVRPSKRFARLVLVVSLLAAVIISSVTVHGCHKTALTPAYKDTKDRLQAHGARAKQDDSSLSVCVDSMRLKELYPRRGKTDGGSLAGSAELSSTKQMRIRTGDEIPSADTYKITSPGPYQNRSKAGQIPHAQPEQRPCTCPTNQVVKQTCRWETVDRVVQRSARGLTCAYSRREAQGRSSYVNKPGSQAAAQIQISISRDPQETSQKVYANEKRKMLLSKDAKQLQGPWDLAYTLSSDSGAYAYLHIRDGLSIRVTTNGSCKSRIDQLINRTFAIWKPCSGRTIPQDPPALARNELLYQLRQNLAADSVREFIASGDAQHWALLLELNRAQRQQQKFVVIYDQKRLGPFFKVLWMFYLDNPTRLFLAAHLTPKGPAKVLIDGVQVGKNLGRILRVVTDEKKQRYAFLATTYRPSNPPSGLLYLDGKKVEPFFGFSSSWEMAFSPDGSRFAYKQMEPSIVRPDKKYDFMANHSYFVLDHKKIPIYFTSVIKGEKRRILGFSHDSKHFYFAAMQRQESRWGRKSHIPIIVKDMAIVYTGKKKQRLDDCIIVGPGAKVVCKGHTVPKPGKQFLFVEGRDKLAEFDSIKKLVTYRHASGFACIAEKKGERALVTLDGMYSLPATGTAEVAGTTTAGEVVILIRYRGKVKVLLTQKVLGQFEAVFPKLAFSTDSSSFAFIAKQGQRTSAVWYRDGTPVEFELEGCQWKGDRISCGTAEPQLRFIRQNLYVKAGRNLYHNGDNVPMPALPQGCTSLTRLSVFPKGEFVVSCDMTKPSDPDIWVLNGSVLAQTRAYGLDKELALLSDSNRLFYYFFAYQFHELRRLVFNPAWIPPHN